MRLGSFLILFFYLTIFCKAQDFVKEYDGNILNSPAYKPIQTIDSGFILVSQFNGFPYFSSGLIKINNYGDTVWTTIISPGDSGSFQFCSIDLVDDSNYVLTGRWKNNTPIDSSRGLCVIKINFYGNIIWNQLILDPGSLDLYNGLIITTYDKDLLIGSGFNLVKLDSSGSFLWSNHYSMSFSSYYYWTFGPIQTTDSAFLISGSSATSDTIFIQKIDKNGSILWRKVIPGTGGHIEFAAYKNGEVILSTNLGLFRLNINGNIIWSKRMSAPGPLSPDGLSITNNYDILVTGQVNSQTHYGLCRYDSLGQLLFAKKLDNINYSFPLSIDETSWGGYCILTGINNSSMSYIPVFIKTDSLFNVPCELSNPISFSQFPYLDSAFHDSILQQTPITLSIQSQQNWQISHGCQVVDLCSGVQVNELSNPTFNVYPNPSSGIIHLASENTISGIFISNIFGEKVFEGPNSQDVNLSSLPKGIYFLTADFFDGTHSVSRIIIE